MEHFDHLRAVLHRRTDAAAPFRAWSAACATGEEAYSIAMVLADLLPAQGWEVFASDNNARVLDTAQRALYPRLRMERVPPDYMLRFCLMGIVEGDAVQISRALRERVDVAQLNLNASCLPVPGKFDAIFLRNVLTYFDRGSAERILQQVLAHLRPGGFLYLGGAEPPRHDTSLQNVAPGIYRKPPREAAAA